MYHVTFADLGIECVDAEVPSHCLAGYRFLFKYIKSS